MLLFFLFLELYSCFYISKSTIHGNGLFSEQKYNIGDFVLIVAEQNLSGDYFVQQNLGGMVNHDLNANCELQFDHVSNNYYLVAIKEIFPDDEITGNYWNTPSIFVKPNF